MIARRFSLPPLLEDRLRAYLSRYQASLDDLEKFAGDVRRLADHYTNEEGARTPWDFAIGYMIYYFPLNVVRLESVIKESFKTFPWESVTSIIDFGSGPGTVQAALEASELSPRPMIAVETDARAVQIHKALEFTKWPCEWRSQLPPRISPGTLGVFSYSLLEENSVARRLKEFDHLLIVTPSTRSQGRKLLQLRTNMMKAGFNSWAPCTHQLMCPLLTQSKTDWCHDRIAFEAPNWYQQLESYLPFQNRTLTFSYWFGSRTQTAPVVATRARVIGDTLVEKGKTRQMICRSSNREFLSWLTRDGEAPSIPRGSTIEIPLDAEVRSNEIRGFRAT